MVQRIALILWGEPAFFWVELVSTHYRASPALAAGNLPGDHGRTGGHGAFGGVGGHGGTRVPARGSRGHDQTRRHLQDYNTLGGRSGQISR